MNAAHRLFGIDEHSLAAAQVPEKDQDGGSLFRYPFHELDIEGLRIKNPDIVIEGKASDPECNPHLHAVGGTYVQCYGGSDLQLGFSVLLHLFFAFSEGMLYATGS
jgi:hypothetical protein